MCVFNTLFHYILFQTYILLLHAVSKYYRLSTLCYTVFYLLKPISLERFMKAVNKAVEQIELQTNQSVGESDDKKDQKPSKEKAAPVPTEPALTFAQQTKKQLMDDAKRKPSRAAVGIAPKSPPTETKETKKQEKDEETSEDEEEGTEISPNTPTEKTQTEKATTTKKTRRRLAREQYLAKKKASRKKDT